MATTYYGEPKLLQEIQEHVNTAFSALFAVEALVKIFGETRHSWGCCSDGTEAAAGAARVPA